MSLAALILGIVGLVGDWFLGWLGIIPPVLAVIFGILGRKSGKNRGMATAGMVMGIIALALWVIVIVLIGIVFAAGSSAVNSAMGSLSF